MGSNSIRVSDKAYKIMVAVQFQRAMTNKGKPTIIELVDELIERKYPEKLYPELYAWRKCEHKIKNNPTI